MPNRLSDSTSPYLLQHQHNPVDWFPWSPEAFQRAQTEDRPIFLSIGYSACHWCHVMEEESFENESTARYLNEHFVSIKVDREQRPDLDHIYMQTVQMLTGSGGWPMSVFLTPHGKPFYGGTYWPPEPRFGRPSFPQVLEAVVDAWQQKRSSLEDQSEELTRALQPKRSSETTPHKTPTDEHQADESLLWKGDDYLADAFDSTYGGFGDAPKFPHAVDLRLLISLQSRKPTPDRLLRITKTLDGMYRGGMFDHLAGGFARYSTDERWLVPHFEKMLYDNALLVPAYLDGFLLTGNSEYAEVARKTLEYVLQDLTDSSGGFYSTRDADSEGIEGKYYVWSREEILGLLGDERGVLFCEAYGVTFGGNFEGKNILHLAARPSELSKISGLSEEEILQQLRTDCDLLLKHRMGRVPPGLDDKILCSWNGMMIVAMARGGVVLDDQRFLEAAKRAFRFIEQSMMTPEGRLIHCWRKGTAETGGFLDDYAHAIEAALTLLECDGSADYADRAFQWLEIVEKHFRDPAGGYYFTSDDSEPLITRFKDQHDGSTPSGNGLMSYLLAKIAKGTNDTAWISRAQSILSYLTPGAIQSTAPYGQFLLALDWWIGPNQETVVVGQDRSKVSRRVQLEHRTLAPRRWILPVTLPTEDATRLEQGPFGVHIRGKEAANSQDVRVYRCQDGRCELPE